MENGKLKMLFTFFDEYNIKLLFRSSFFYETEASNIGSL